MTNGAIEEDIVKILKVGTQAASVLNSQPWRFVITGNKVSVYILRMKGGPLDFRYIEIYSTACLLENILEGARHYHYAVTYPPFTENVPENSPSVELEFTQLPAAEEYPIDHVLDRHTNRKLYYPTPIPPDIPEAIIKLFRSDTARAMDLSENREFIKTCVDIENIRAHSEIVGNAVYDFIHFDQAKADSLKTGLDIRTLEIPPLVSFFYRMTNNRLIRAVTQKMNLMGFLAPRYHKKLLGSSPLILVFVDTNVERGNMIANWMKIQRVLNLLHRQGLASQLVASGFHLLKSNRNLFNHKELASIESASIKAEKILNAKLDDVVTILRVGYAQPCRYRSKRMNIQDLLIRRPS